MFKLSRDDLHRKTEGQLTNLFNLATREIRSAPRLSIRFQQASNALRLIREELARRGVRLTI